MSGDERSIVVTELVANIPEDKVYPHSVQRWCAMCGEPIWLSPAALYKVNQGEVDPWCAPCAIPYMEAQKAAGQDVKVGNVDPSAPTVNRDLLDWLKGTYGR